MLIEWSAKIELGISEMDTEHRRIVQLMNDLFDLNQRNEGRRAILAKFAELVTYTQKHFADEEALLEQIKYPKLINHSIIHKQLMRKLSEHRENFESGNEAHLSKDIFAFLKGWLTSHIMGIDRQYAEGMASANAS